jgi:hypothetical protein
MHTEKSRFVSRSEMVRLEYAVVTQAEPALAWKIFSDWRRWSRFSDFYGNIRWLAGQPWMVGSRLQIELVRPVRTTVDHVITVCSPPDRVAWIDHFRGYTMEQWVVFEPLADGGTRVRTWAEIVGPTLKNEGVAVGDVIKDFIELWYSRFCSECDGVHEAECAVLG